MTDHPDAVQLLAWAETGGANPALAAHVAGCGQCRGEVADLRAVTAVLAQAGVLAAAPRARATLAAAMAASARERLAPPARRRRLGVALAAAALVLVAVVWSLRTPELLVQAEVARTEVVDAPRGGPLRFHLRLTLARPGEITALVVEAPARARLLFPVDEALVPRLAMPSPLPSGTLRLPADSLFDFETRDDLRGVFVVPSAQLLDPAARAWLVQTVTAALAAEATPAALARAHAALAARYPGTQLSQLPR